jgi:GNAT superfamily N-acetyltransferase
MLPIQIVEADLSQPDHQSAVVELIDGFAIDRTGESLSVEVRQNLIPGLHAHLTTIIFLAYQGNETIGIAVCFRGFSTFAARPLLYIHDLFVLSEYRGQGAGQRLLAAIEQKAWDTDCCKLTLEVQANNQRAREIYEVAGFVKVAYQEAAGGLVSLSKSLQ